MVSSVNLVFNLRIEKYLEHTTGTTFEYSCKETLKKKAIPTMMETWDKK